VQEEIGMSKMIAVSLTLCMSVLFFAGCKQDDPAGPTYDLKLTYPVGGEVWQAGDSVTITWEESANIGGVMVWLSTDNQKNWGNGVSNGVALNGSGRVMPGLKHFGWKIPANVQTGDTCFIWIHEYNTLSMESLNASPFKIQ
jgi:hypothetical protein